MKKSEKEIILNQVYEAALRCKYLELERDEICATSPNDPRSTRRAWLAFEVVTALQFLATDLGLGPEMVTESNRACADAETAFRSWRSPATA